MDMPKGCSKAVLIAYIEDKSMRPAPDYAWVIDVQGKRSSTVTCRQTLDDAIAFARENLH